MKAISFLDRTPFWAVVKKTDTFKKLTWLNYFSITKSQQTITQEVIKYVLDGDLDEKIRKNSNFNQVGQFIQVEDTYVVTFKTDKSMYLLTANNLLPSQPVSLLDRAGGPSCMIFSEKNGCELCFEKKSIYPTKTTVKGDSQLVFTGCDGDVQQAPLSPCNSAAESIECYTRLKSDIPVNFELSYKEEDKGFVMKLNDLDLQNHLKFDKQILKLRVIPRDNPCKVANSFSSKVNITNTGLIKISFNPSTSCKTSLGNNPRTVYDLIGEKRQGMSAKDMSFFKIGSQTTKLQFYGPLTLKQSQSRLLQQLQQQLPPDVIGTTEIPNSALKNFSHSSEKL